MFFIIIVSILFIVYAAIIFYYKYSWQQIPVTNSITVSSPITFSVIIPARNEEENIGKLLQSLQKQSYVKNLFEVIVVDDHSTDTTASIVQSFADVHYRRLNEDDLNSYKKKAIETGIAAAKNDWIVCTDADCTVHENWLATFASLIQNLNPVFIAAPVVFNNENTVLNYFQNLDFLTLQGITGASVYKKIHTMCNGANLAYRKNVFYEVDGFKGIDTIASGDDMLLMHKIWQKYPDKISYLKSQESIVETMAAKSWKEFFNQRIRWASKAKSYDDKRIFWVLILVYLFNFSFLFLITASFFDVKYFYALLLFWIAKTLVEMPFIITVSKFFSKQKLVKYFFVFQPLHIAYTIFAGFLGSFGKYEWKGRRVK
jgi:poly-beta-1,6-N-acetyl-D-glucosamine synthase